ncbi:DUF6396 domain-containing protein [Rouxiella sp. Mn2063]|uniref:DUF6396 domain-containing protein n=1 Tax=Rouxiella sp. Mn2063 TaxID=3395262 RepID=UPI003BEBFB5D
MTGLIKASKRYPRLLLLSSLLLAGCDQGSSSAAVNKGISVAPLTEINANLAFTCTHERFPEPAADPDILFKYARWLQVNNLLKQDAEIDVEIARLYRIAAENGHVKANINLQNGALRGRFSLTGEERLRFSQQLIDVDVASGYYFIAIYLQHGAAGLKQDDEMALRYYRKAADEGSGLAQAYVAEKLIRSRKALDVASQMERCAAKQGNGKSASMLGITLQDQGHYQEAMEAFQLGAAAGDSASASWLSAAFLDPEPSDELNYMGQQKDEERARRYKAIWRVLSNYSYASPKVPEINEIVPLPPAKLPAWDGKLQWVEAWKANVPTTKPSAALIAQLAQDKQLNPVTGRPLPTSPNFDKDSVAYLLCRSGEPCPYSGYWQVVYRPYIGSSQRDICYFKQGEVMPTDLVEIFRPRPWPLSDHYIQQEQWVEWQLVGEA